MKEEFQMANHEELPMADQDDAAGQQVAPSVIDKETLSGEQISLPEEEGQGDPFESSQDNQGALPDQESPQETMRMEEPGVQLPDEVGILPEGQGELIDPTMEQVGQETPDRLPADQTEKEVVPVTLDEPK
jgi:hypothetical protein